MIAEAASSCMYSIQLFTDIFKIVFFLFFCIFSTYTLVAKDLNLNPSDLQSN